MASWRYSVGRKGVSRCTVFERADATSLFVEWWDDDGRHRAALSTITGHPITDKDLAIEAVQRMSAAQERKRNQSAADALGGRPPLVGRSDRVGVFLYISEIMRLMDVPDEPGLPLGWEGVPVIE